MHAKIKYSVHGITNLVIYNNVTNNHLYNYMFINFDAYIGKEKNWAKNTKKSHSINYYSKNTSKHGFVKDWFMRFSLKQRSADSPENLL